MLEPMHYLKATVSVMMGACFFAGLTLVSYWESAWEGILRRLRGKAWRQFRERELPKLNTDLLGNGREANLILGALPITLGEKQHYFLPHAHKEVLIQVQLNTAKLTANLELDYVLHGTDPNGPREHFYFFAHPFTDNHAPHYTTVAFWYPVPADHNMEVALEGIHNEGNTGSIESCIRIIGLR
jgi:hypothetical protein